MVCLLQKAAAAATLSSGLVAKAVTQMLPPQSQTQRQAGLMLRDRERAQHRESSTSTE